MKLIDLAKRNFKSKYDNLIQQAKEIKNCDLFATNTDLARKLRNRAREVMGEYHRLSAFLRLDVYPEMLLFTNVELLHDTTDMLMRHFRDRYPTFIVGLYCNGVLHVDSRRDELEVFAKKFKTKDSAIAWLRDLLKTKISERIDTKKWSEDYWTTFYHSQYIPERKNLKLANKFLPKKFRIQADMLHEDIMIKKEKRGASSSLDDYL